jgi:hypothetical protein
LFARLYKDASLEARPQIYSLTDLCLAAALRIWELTLLLLLFSSLAPLLYKALNSGLGPGPAEPLSILCSAGAWLLLRFPLLAARSQLRHSFGLDPRPLGKRLGPLALRSLAALIPMAAFGQIMYWALARLPLFPWAALYVLLVFAGYALAIAVPTFAFALSPKRFRQASDDELPPEVGAALRALPGGERKTPEAWVDMSFQEGLKSPKVVLGRLIIPQKALSSFPPQALRSEIVTAVLAHLVKIPRNTVIHRFLSLLLSAPITLILLNSLGMMAGYPLLSSPGLVALLWMGGWLTWQFSEFSALLLARAINPKLSAATIAVTRDVPGLLEAIDILARYNMEPFSCGFIQGIFRERPSPESQIKRLKASLLELTDEAERDLGRRKAKVMAEAGGGDGPGAKPKAEAEAKSEGASGDPGDGKPDGGNLKVN